MKLWKHSLAFLLLAGFAALHILTGASRSNLATDAPALAQVNGTAVDSAIAKTLADAVPELVHAVALPLLAVLLIILYKQEISNKLEQLGDWLVRGGRGGWIE